VATECGEVAADMMGAHSRGELFYYRPINYDRYSRVHAQDFEPLMTQRNCLTPGRVSPREILRFLLKLNQGFLYSASYRETRPAALYKSSEVAVDRQQPMVLQR